jgi:hypothetical protein
VRAPATDQTLFHYRFADLGAAGDHRLGAGPDRRHHGSVAAPAPEAIHPRSLFGFDLPGVGAILTLLIIVVTGLLAANFIGQRLVVWWELLLARIPVVNSIYNSVKQVSDTLFSSSGNAFRQALLIEYPRRGAWTIAFLTGKPGGEMLRHLEGIMSASTCRRRRIRPRASSSCCPGRKSSNCR